MNHYAVIREAGPAWVDGGIADQPAIADHASFMNALAADGFVLFAGPLAGTEQGRLRALLIIDAENRPEIHNRLADDPWATSGQLQITSIEPWNVIVGANRLATTNAAATPALEPPSSGYSPMARPAFISRRASRPERQASR